MQACLDSHLMGDENVGVGVDQYEDNDDDEETYEHYKPQLMKVSLGSVYVDLS